MNYNGIEGLGRLLSSIPLVLVLGKKQNNQPPQFANILIIAPLSDPDLGIEQ